MRKFSVICLLLVLVLIGLAGCGKDYNYAKSPEEVVGKYLEAASKQDEKTMMACVGIIWDDNLAGFLDNEYAGASMTASNIIYKENPDPKFDANSAIQEWLVKAAEYGLTLEYTYNDIISYGVVYCDIIAFYNGETETLEGATFDVIQTAKGWFMVSIDTAR